MSTGSQTHKTDVLVVGAGPTGLLLANLLGTMGVRTTLIERNTETVQEPRAVSIDDESMRAMQAAGLAEEVEQITARGYGSIYRGPSGGVFATVKPSIKEYGFDKRNAFQQPELEALLRGALTRFDCVNTHFATEMAAFEQSGGRVTAQCQGDTNLAISARYMVACDGGRSEVRKSLGISMKGSSFEEPWLIVDLESTKNRCFHTEVFCDPRRPCITLPGPNGIRRYEFMLRGHQKQEMATNEELVRKLLADVGPDANEPFRRVRVYTFHARMAERWRDGRVFLAGDAAHLTPPFAGQGMNSGLRDAHNLAWKLAEALHTDDPEALLDSYETERKPHAWSLITLALRMGRIMMPTSLIQGALVRGGFRILGLYPPARDYFAEMRYKPKPRFRDGLIWPDSQKPAHTVIGRMIPQPIVETVERRRMLLDECLPDRPAVIVLSEQPDQALTPESRGRFEAVGMTVLGLTPEGINPRSADFSIVRDHGRFFSQDPYPRYLEHAVLLRRDRYIAAARPVGKASELVGAAAMLSPQIAAAIK